MAEFTAVDLFQIEDLLTPEERAVRDRARGWVEERAVPVVRQHYRAGTLPLELTREIAALGAFGGNISGYGCAGLSSVAYGLIMQELERADTGLRTFASVQGALGMNAIHMFGSEEQKERWLPSLARGETLTCFGLTEPLHGSNPGGMTSTAVKTADGYRLTGEKMWIGNGTLSDVLVVWAKVDGLPGVDPQSPAAIRGFLVERGTPGLHSELIEGKLSLRVGMTARLRFDNCPLPESALLPNGAGLKAPLKCLNHARYGIAWGVIGAAMACFDEARQYALNRQQFDRPIAGFQLIQRKLALMLTEITKAQLVAWRLGRLKEAGKATHVQISLAKRNNVAMALDVARTCRDILGGVGILDDYQSMRHACNLESVITYEGTDDMHLLILGEHITGVSAFK
jgi:glutaryl-CoA dehydrogenase